MTSSVTAKSSSGAGGTAEQQFGELAAADTGNNLKQYNPFDEVLQKASGDIEVLMRISHDSYLLERIISCMKHMAFGVKMSLHQNL